MPDDCDSPEIAIADEIRQSILGAAQLLSSVQGAALGALTDAVSSASGCCDKIASQLGAEIASPVDQGDRLIDQIGTRATVRVQEAIAAATSLANELESGQAAETPADAPQTPQAGETAAGEEETGPDETAEIATPTAEEIDKFGQPAAEPSAPAISVTSSGLSGFLKSCQPDQYAKLASILQPLQSLRASVLGASGGQVASPSVFASALKGTPLGALPFAAETIEKLGNWLIGKPNALAEGWAALTGCGSALTSTLSLELIADLITTWASPGFGEMMQPVKYARRALCPNGFPTPAEAHAAYQANAISEDILKSWLAINNQCWEPQKAIIEANRRKLGPGELLDLRLRGEIDAQGWADGLRAIGFTDTDDHAKLWKLGEFIPPYTDQVRFMVRDVFRTDVVKKFGLDDLFGDAFSSEAQTLAGKLGIQEATMRQLWRAHWSIPAPGQLAEMFHRLPYVPDDFLADINAALGKAGSSRRISRAELSRERVFTDVAQAMIQQDILPYWIPRLLAITFRPLTRREVRQAFEVGAIDEARAIDAHREIGISPENARALVEFIKTRRDQQAAGLEPTRLYKQGVITKDEARKRLAGLNISPVRIDQVLADADETFDGFDAVKDYAAEHISRADAEREMREHGISAAAAGKILARVDRRRSKHDVLAKYREGMISRDGAAAVLTGAGWTDKQGERALAAVDDELKSQRAKFCARHVRKRFLLGELTEQQARTQLAQLGLKEHLIAHHTSQWRCEQDSIGKHPPTATLCRWLNMGLITTDDMARRLMNVGWTLGDAQNIIIECQMKHQTKEAKNVEREIKRQLAAADKARRAAERQGKASDKQLAALAKNRAKAEAARERREKRLVKAADKLAARLGTDLADALRQARAQLRRGLQEYGFSPDERIEVLEQAVEKWPKEDDQTWPERFEAVADARAGAERFA